MNPLIEDPSRRRRVLDIIFSDSSTGRERPRTTHIIRWHPPAGGPRD